MPTRLLPGSVGSFYVRVADVFIVLLYMCNSLRSKRFRLVSEQRKTRERPRKGTFGFDRARNETRATSATFLAVFDSRPSFFSPKPYRNACYAG